MIRPGTLLIQKGTELPPSVLLKSVSGTDEWTTVEGDTELLQLKEQLASAGWNYFYMWALTQTSIGAGSKGVSSAMKGITAKMRLNRCNSLQIDAINAHSLLGIPYTSVSAHCCHIQEGVTFAGVKQ